VILQSPGHYFAVVSRIGRGVRQHWPTRQDEEQNGQKRGRRKDQSEKEGMRLHPEKRACPRRGNTPTVKAVLDRHQSERGGKGCWDTEQLDRDWASSFRARIASEPPCPREARVRALRTGEDHVRGAWRSCGGRRQAHINALVSHELDAGAPVFSAAGVAPEQRRGTHSQRMQQHTHLAWLCDRAPIPLTVLAQRARAAGTNTGRIDHPQTSVRFPTPLLDAKRLPCWTLERPIGLERKVLARKAPGFPGSGRGRRALP
jgi:hypothetical protein